MEMLVLPARHRLFAILPGLLNATSHGVIYFQPTSALGTNKVGEDLMKKALIAAATLVALPVLAQAQSLQYPGFYVGVEGGVNWMLNTTILNQSVSPNTGFAAGGVVGYDFVGPRVEIEGVYRNNTNNTGYPGLAISNQINQVAVLANLLYDFSPGSVITP
jgi:OmpA-OmpF porin, OOP family